MSDTPWQIEPLAEGQSAALAALYRAAFPDEDLTGVVDALGREPGCLGLVAGGADPVGHVALTPCRVAPGGTRVWLLGPLAVAPAHQGAGLGTALVRAALSQNPEERLLVLGDPGYYGRFGFTPEPAIETPHPIPEDWRSAWQGIGPAAPPGRLTVPAAWDDPALWSP